jgi:3'(2'), 5'-bisphosphate nucleotidase
MSSLDLQHFLDALLPEIETAAKKIRHIYTADFDVWYKEDGSPVTSADMASNQHITQALTALTPDILIVSEESPLSPAQLNSTNTYWLVDPLDGTRDFVEKTGDFSVVVALIYQQQPVLGVVYEPMTDTVFYALKGHGAFVKSPQLGLQSMQLQSAVQPPSEIRLIISGRESEARYRQHLHPNYSYQFIKKGSCALKCCWVAQAEADCYLRFGTTSFWDTAAAQCLIEEAGGIVCGLNWQPLTYDLSTGLHNPKFMVLGDTSLPWAHILQIPAPAG